MALYDYRWASGFNVALANLRNVETDLFPYTTPRLVAPQSGIVNTLPRRTKMLNASVKGDGTINLEWRFSTLSITALEYIIDTYLTTANVVQASKAMTIYTRQAELNTYTRYNAYLELPVPGIDYTYRQNAAVDLVLRFSGLSAI